MQQLRMFQVEQVVDAEHLFRLGNTLLTEGYDLGLDVDDIVTRRNDFIVFAHDLFLETFDKAVRLQIQVGRLLHTAGNDQRRPRLIDENGVNLIDQRKVQTAQNTVLRIRDHVVTQIIEAELRIGCIGNIAVIGGTLLGGAHLARIVSDTQTEKLMNASHPFRVTLRKIFVDGDDMDTFA